MGETQHYQPSSNLRKRFFFCCLRRKTSHHRLNKKERTKDHKLMTPIFRVGREQDNVKSR